MIAEQAQQTAETKISSQKERAASTLETVANTLRESGQNIRDEQPQIASLTDEAARRVEDISSYVREHDIRDFVNEAERFARREPLLFLGGAFAIGFAAARFLKASSPSGGNGNRQTQMGGGYGAGYGGAGYSWRPDTGFGGGTRGEMMDRQPIGGGYGAGTGAYAGGSADYATTPGTDYAGTATTGEFGDRTDYGATSDLGGTDLGGTTDLGDSGTRTDEAYDADETHNR